MSAVNAPLHTVQAIYPGWAIKQKNASWTTKPMDKDKWPDRESAKTLAQISSVIFQSTVYSSSADVPRI